MKLYKNVGLADLEAILTEGVLPISRTGNDNWEDGLRVDNSIEVVYLHKPLGEQNSFTQYGLVLLEIETDNATFVELDKTDSNAGLYEEYIASEIKPEEITAVYAPAVFKERIKNSKTSPDNIWDEDFIPEQLIPDNIFSQITWIDIEVSCYQGNGLEKAKPELFKQWAKTAYILSSFNHLRGVKENNEVIDIYEEKYII